MKKILVSLMAVILLVGFVPAPVSAAEPQQTVYESLPTLMESDLSRATIGWTRVNVPGNTGVSLAPNVFDRTVTATGQYRLEIRNRPQGMRNINVGIIIGNQSWVITDTVATQFIYNANQGQRLQIRFSTNSQPGPIEYRIVRIA